MQIFSLNVMLFILYRVVSLSSMYNPMESPVITVLLVNVKSLMEYYEGFNIYTRPRSSPVSALLLMVQ